MRFGVGERPQMGNHAKRLVVDRKEIGYPGAGHRRTRRCTFADHLTSPRLLLAAVAGSVPFTAGEFDARAQA